VNAPYRNRQLIVAAIVGAMTGWSLIVFPMAIVSLWQDDFSSEGWLQARNMVILLGLFGIPIALVTGLLAGLPIMKIAMRRGKHSYRDALVFGAFAGLIVGLLLLVSQLLQGLGDYFDDRTIGSYGGGQGNLWANGMPTALGWWNELRNLAYFSFVGAGAGLASRCSIGTPRQSD
jgi:hypothetical protein